MQKKTIALSLAAILATGAAGSVVYAQVVPQGPTRAEVQDRAAHAFDRLDVNLDGQIDASDRAEAQGERLRVRFDTADANGDGALAFEEFTELRSELAENRRGRRGEEMGGRHGHRRGGIAPLGLAGTPADTNGDGTITQAEFSAATLGHFDRADANDDGVMTREEGMALRQAIRSEVQARRQQARPAPQPVQGS